MTTIHDGPSGSQRVLITGIGRSGTKYMSELLTAAGLPCGHESVFTPDSPWCAAIDQQAACALDWHAQAESSWYAAPWAQVLRDHGVFLVHVVRNPRDWLASWVLTVWPRARKNPATRDFLARAVPSIRGTHRSLQIAIDTDPVGTAHQLWLLYNQMAGDFAHCRLRVEHVDAAAIAMLARCSDQKATEALTSVPRNINSRSHGILKRTRSWPAPARQLAAYYGYEI